MSEVIRVDEWQPVIEDFYVKYSGKLIIINFDEIFNRDKSTALNTFVIKKDSYVKPKILDIITGYVNYFIKFYDTDKELLLSYLKLKYIIDDKNKPIKTEAFISILYYILFTDTLKEKIRKMVEDNYYVDLKPDSDKKYSEALEFTNENAKVMMQISVSMKIMVPLILHYINTNNLNKKVSLFKFYEKLFDVFSGDDNIYDKLWISTYSRINKNYSINRVVWEQREIFGVNTLTYLDTLLKDKIISETMFKYRFDKNIVNFNSVVLDNQLKYFIIEQHSHNLVELSYTKDVDGLSGVDKLEMNSNKIDESLLILSKINIKKTIKKLKKTMNLKITDEELDFYRKHLKINKFQVQLVYYYYAKNFGGYRDLNMLNRKQYLILLLLLKHKLHIQGFVYLPQILTSNIETKLNTRTIQNTKFLTRLENSVIYQTIMEDKFSTLNEIKKNNLIINILSTLINTGFALVDYSYPEKLHQRIIPNVDKLSDEFLDYLNQL